MIKRVYHWLKAAWQSLPFLEKYRATELQELNKALKTQIFSISGYLLAALINTAAAITFPYYSLGVFNAVFGGVVGGTVFMLFDFILKTSIAFHRVIAARKNFRLNHANVKCLRLIASRSENIPGPKHTYTYRDLSISDTTNNHGYSQSSLGILFYDFYANFSDVLNGYHSHTVHCSGRPLTHCMVELADMFQQYEVEHKGG